MTDDGKTVQRSLGEIFDEHATYALQTFAKRYRHLETVRPTSFVLDYFVFPKPNAWIGSDGDHEETCTITVTDSMVTLLAEGLDLCGDEGDVIYGLRVFWLIHHELGHWLWGHLPYYDKRGWFSALGMAEAVVKQSGNTASTFTAKLAELQADSFATTALIDEIGANFAAEDDVDIDPELYGHLRNMMTEEAFIERLSDTIHMVTYITFCTIGLLYFDNRDQEEFKFHPPWRTRALNISAHCFRFLMALTVDGAETKAGMYVKGDVLNPVAVTFAEATSPALEATQLYFDEAGVKIAIIQGDDTPLFSAAEIGYLIMGTEGKTKSVDEILNLYAYYDEFVSECAEAHPIENFLASFLHGETADMADTHDYKVGSVQSEEEAQLTIEEWAKHNGLEVVSLEFRKPKGPGIAEHIDLIVDITFRALEYVGADEIQVLVRKIGDLLAKKRK